MTGTTWAKFFWADWESDEALRMCSPSAQALWMRMLCVCAKAGGYLTIGGSKLGPDDMAKQTGWASADVQIWWDELKRWGVFSVEGRGKVYCRRMVRDAKRSEIGRETGKRGGNPALCKDEENTSTLNGDANGLPGTHARINTEPEATSKREAKASVSPTEVRKPPSTGKRTYPPEFEAAWKAYPHHQGRSSKPESAAEWRRLPADEQRDLVDCIAAFAPHVERVCGGKGAPCMSRWLKQGKHLNWRAESDAPLLAAPFEDHWRRRIDAYRRNQFWNRLDWGPPPDKPDCTVPAEILAACGFGGEGVVPFPRSEVA